MEPIINFRTAVLNLFWTLLPRHFLFIVCKISCKILFLYITVKLDFDIDRKSANFNFKNPQNISLRFHFIMHLLWTFHGTHNILIMVINFIKLDGTGHWYCITYGAWKRERERNMAEHLKSFEKALTKEEQNRS